MLRPRQRHIQRLFKMCKIIFFNKKEDVDKLLDTGRDSVKYVVLDEFIKKNEIYTYLQKNKRFLKVDLNQYLNPEDFRKMYIDFISGLNKKNESIFWWGLNFPNRHPAASDLPKKVWYLVALQKFLEKEKPDLLLIYTEDKNIVSQFKIWHQKTSLKIEDRVVKKIKIWDKINSLFPLYIFLIFLRTIVYKTCSHLLIYSRLMQDKKYIVLRTILSGQSFREKDEFRDIYFGKLCDFIKEKDIPILIFTTISAPFLTNLKKIFYNRRKYTFVLLEQSISFINLLKCLFHSLKAYFIYTQPKGNFCLNGLDYKFTIKCAIREESKTQRLYSNLLVYYSTLSLAKKINIDRFIYPFENRGWEKLSLKAIKSVEKDIKTIGYQHASISLMLMNYCVGKEEHDMVPLPDRLVTMGSVTRDILKDICGFPENILRKGCGLRQGKSKDIVSLRDRKKEIKNILVPLALSSEEYVKGLIFLNEAFKNCDKYNINLRPHTYPVMPINEALSYVPDLKFKFSIDKNRRFDQSLSEADLVLYFSTTASLEALSQGIPVVNIDPGFFLSPDPLFKMHDFKWIVQTPEELIKIIRAIDGLEDNEYYTLRKKACQYVIDYSHPVTDKSMSAFIG